MAKPTEQEIKNLGRYFAITTNNEFWRLSEKELTTEEKRDILGSAFTSLYHWKQVGNDENKYQPQEQPNFGVRRHRFTPFLLFRSFP